MTKTFFGLLLSTMLMQTVYAATTCDNIIQNNSNSVYNIDVNSDSGNVSPVTTFTIKPGEKASINYGEKPTGLLWISDSQGNDARFRYAPNLTTGCPYFIVGAQYSAFDYSHVVLNNPKDGDISFK